MDYIRTRIEKYIQNQEYTIAIEELNSLIDKKTDIVILLILRGDIYNKKQEYSKALNDYNRALKLEPRNKKIASKIEIIKDILKFQALDIYGATNLNKDPWLDD
ncbi:tetratricopeptide repeat protein [Bacteroidota bacterium]